MKIHRCPTKSCNQARRASRVREANRCHCVICKQVLAAINVHGIVHRVKPLSESIDKLQEGARLLTRPPIDSDTPVLSRTQAIVRLRPSDAAQGLSTCHVPCRASAPQECKRPSDSDQLKPLGECRRSFPPPSTRPRRAIFIKHPSDSDQLKPPGECWRKLLPPSTRPRRARHTKKPNDSDQI